jgi:putative hydrolase of the HAD superfamily
MGLRAVVFDIGGVLEIVPDLGVTSRWEVKLGFAEGEIARRLGAVWAAGAIGTVTESDVRKAMVDLLEITAEQAEAMSADSWVEYLGVANTELIEYARGLRPRLRTGILSNSFVGAREREQAAYGFEDLVDDIVYSHEVGMSKPDPRIFELTCERLEVPAGEVIFIDNQESHVVAAQEVGLHGVHHRETAQTIGEVERLLAALA